MTKVIYPGSFDPFTFGHLDILQRGIEIFKEIHVVVLNNPQKKYLFSQEERAELIRETIREQGIDDAKITVTVHEGLLVDYAKQNGITKIIRGLRMVTDFEYEFQLNAINKKLMPSFETIFLMTGEQYSYLSSSTIRELASFGADISPFVAKCVVNAINLADVKLKLK